MVIMRIWPRLRVDKFCGFETVGIQVLAHILLDLGTNTFSVWVFNIPNKYYLVKVGVLLYPIHRLISYSIIFSNIPFLKVWVIILSWRWFFQSVLNLVVPIYFNIIDRKYTNMEILNWMTNLRYFLHLYVESKAIVLQLQHTMFCPYISLEILLLLFCQVWQKSQDPLKNYQYVAGNNWVKI